MTHDLTNLDKVAFGLSDDGEAAVITDSDLRFWLTGFRSSAGTLLISRGERLLLVDFRYIEAARDQAQGVQVELTAKIYDQIRAFLARVGAKRVAFVDNLVTVREAESYKKELADYECVFEPALAGLLADLAMIKTAAELSSMKKAQEITDRALAEVLPSVKAGTVERELALAIEVAMRKMGAEGVSFDPIVVSGVNSSKPHGVPGSKKIAEGEFVTMDIGCKYRGYCSDMTRTVCVGQPTAEMQKVYDLVLKAQLAAIAVIKPGMKCCDVDKVARDMIYGAGYEGCFGHGLGHSLGVRIHESPAFNPSCQTVLQPGMVLSVEPGIYLAGRFGVRIEDVIIVTETGCEDITGSPK